MYSSLGTPDIDQGLKHAGRVWPVRTLSAARDGFGEFSNN